MGNRSCHGNFSLGLDYRVASPEPADAFQRGLHPLRRDLRLQPSLRGSRWLAVEYAACWHRCLKPVVIADKRLGTTLVAGQCDPTAINTQLTKSRMRILSFPHARISANNLWRANAHPVSSERRGNWVGRASP